MHWYGPSDGLRPPQDDIAFEALAGARNLVHLSFHHFRTMKRRRVALETGIETFYDALPCEELCISNRIEPFVTESFLVLAF
jgi:hypothetical protein